MREKTQNTLAVCSVSGVLGDRGTVGSHLSELQFSKLQFSEPKNYNIHRNFAVREMKSIFFASTYLNIQTPFGPNMLRLPTV